MTNSKRIAKINTAARADFHVNAGLNLFKSTGPELLAALAKVNHEIAAVNAIDADIDPVIVSEGRIIAGELKRRKANRIAKKAARLAA